MSLYTTPLQLGYFFSLLLWILFNVRGFQEQRLSDKILGWIMFLLAIELQDYTFGFAGINILWNELNGFPRGVSLIFGPIVYFYFRAQVNRSFSFQKSDIWHFIPYGLYFIYEISAFLQGPEAVIARQSSTYNLIINYILLLMRWISYGYYLFKCLNIYRKYRKWSINQFSNTDLIDFSWFRNFIIAMIFWLLFREVINVLDAFLDLDFYQDWWWNLALVAVSLYIGLTGYAQKQPANIHFELDNLGKSHQRTFINSEGLKNESLDSEKTQVAKSLQLLMNEDRLFIQPDLNLQELAHHLQVNPVLLSSTINQILGKNFNDYINNLRIEEFVRLYNLNNKQYTMLSIAFESGFNSKATFNRAFKKIKGCSPKEYLESKS